MSEMESIYPMKFKPVFKAKIWGGHKIKSILNMDDGGLPNCGEVWLLSGVAGNPSVLENGYLAGNELNELVEVFMGDLVGDKVYDRFGDQFPILVKVIDSNDWLSIQVHPDDALAGRRGIGNGKTELWYVMQADEGAQLISGFNKELNREEYLKVLEAGNLRSIMNYESVRAGDVFFMPAGRVHALGPGTLIAEIQQTSDTTYRIYDWDRVDHTGQTRELHTEESLEAIDFQLPDEVKTNYESQMNQTSQVIESPFFTTNILKFNQGIQKDYSRLDSFVILMSVEGNCLLHWGAEENIRLNAGEAVLIPNLIHNVALIPDASCKILELYIQ